MPHIDVNGQSIHYTDSGGDGPPVAFTGALMCDTVVLQPLADTLAEAGYRAAARRASAVSMARSATSLSPLTTCSDWLALSDSRVSSLVVS